MVTGATGPLNVGVTSVCVACCVALRYKTQHKEENTLQDVTETLHQATGYFISGIKTHDRVLHKPYTSLQDGSEVHVRRVISKHYRMVHKPDEGVTGWFRSVEVYLIVLVHVSYRMLRDAVYRVVQNVVVVVLVVVENVVENVVVMLRNKVKNMMVKINVVENSTNVTKCGEKCGEKYLGGRECGEKNVVVV